MKQTEKILGALIIILMVTRLLYNYPFSAIAITFSILILSMIYFGFSFALLNNIRFRNILKKESFKGISTLRILGVIFTGFTLSSTLIYCLFKFQRWPYGNEGLLISIYGLLIIIVVALIKYLTTKDKFYSTLLIRLFIIGVVSVSLYSISHEKLLEIKHKDAPEYIENEKRLLNETQQTN